MRRTARSSSASFSSWRISARVPRSSITRRSANGWQRRKISRNGAFTISHHEEPVMHTQIYLFFDGRAEEALDFYKKTLGIEVEMLMRYKDAPPEAKEGCAPGSENK